MNQFYDVVIVGAGPAGASAATHLARGGARVLLAEAKKFPRAKLCGEFISPECLTHFARLGVLDEMLQAGGVNLRETVFYTRRGSRVHVPSAWFVENVQTNFSTCALGLSRAEMDARMLRRAREAGAEILEEANAVGLIFDETKAVRGVRLKLTDGVREVFGKVLIDATGRTRALARRVTKENNKQHDELKKRTPLVAFKAHLSNVKAASNACEIYFYRGGYGGLNAVEGGASNLCFIVTAKDARELSDDANNLGFDASEHKAERLMREVVFQNKRAAKVLKDARVVSSWQAVALERFGRGALVPAKNLLTVGDAAAFIDPFTGSGMLMALESGELVARAIAKYLKREVDFDELAREYTTSHALKFDARLRLCAWLRRAAFAPGVLIEATARALNVSESWRKKIARATRRAPTSNESRSVETS